jgi:hypothetical protein
LISLTLFDEKGRFTQAPEMFDGFSSRPALNGYPFYRCLLFRLNGDFCCGDITNNKHRRHSMSTAIGYSHTQLHNFYQTKLKLFFVIWLSHIVDS